MADQAVAAMRWPRGVIPHSSACGFSAMIYTRHGRGQCDESTRTARSYEDFQEFASSSARCYLAWGTAYITLDTSTMHGPAIYANQLLARTIDTLATAPGDVRSRILAAYKAFNPLRADHFPVELRSEWEWIEKQLTKHPPQLDHRGEIRKCSVEVSLRHMKNMTGVKIAEKLLRLHHAVDAHVNPR